MPLTELTRSDVPWAWDTRHQDAFDHVKSLVTSAPCLALVDFSDPYVPLELHTDASQYAVGGTLLTVQDGTSRPVAYYSRKLNEAERNYSATDRELLAVVYCLQ